MFGAFVTTCSQNFQVKAIDKEEGRHSLNLSRRKRCRILEVLHHTCSDLLPVLSWQIRRRSALGCLEMRVTSAHTMPCKTIPAFIQGKHEVHQTFIKS